MQKIIKKTGIKTKASRKLRELHARYMAYGEMIYKDIIPDMSLLEMAEKIEEMTGRLVEKFPTVDPDYYFTVKEPETKRTPKKLFANIGQLFKNIWNWKWDNTDWGKEKLMFSIGIERSFTNWVGKKSKAKIYGDRLDIYFRGTCRIRRERYSKEEETEKIQFYNVETGKVKNPTQGMALILNGVEIRMLDGKDPIF